MHLSARIEAILFYKAEPVAIARLAEMLKVSLDEITTALEELRTRYEGTGLALMQNGSDVMLATAPGASPLIETLAKDELSREIGKAGIETLSIVLYRGPVTRSEIDYIRGVNSTFMLRALLTRGLIERMADPQGGRVPLYRPTFELLSHLGVARAEDLPEYASVRAELAAFEAGKEAHAEEMSQSPEASPVPEDAPEDDGVFDDDYEDELDAADDAGSPEPLAEEGPTESHEHHEGTA